MATVARLTLDAVTSQRLDADESGTVSGSTIVLFPQASGTIVYGASGTLLATGVRQAVVAGQVIEISLPAGESLYAFCASATLAVDVLRFG